MGITNSGRAEITNLAGDVDSPTAFTYLELGDDNTAFAATQTALISAITGNGLARASATVTQEETTVSNDTLQLTHQWTVTGSETVKEIGIFNASSGGDMLARKVLSSAKSLSSGDTYTGTYKIIVG